MNRLRAILSILVSLVILGVNVTVAGLIIALVRGMGWLAYPAYFGTQMMLVGLVLVILVPAQRKHQFTIGFFRRLLTVDDKRFDKSIWLWFRRRGPFTLILAASLILGPFVGAWTARFLGLDEHRSWLYTFISTILTTLVWVSIYLGVADLLREYLRTVF